VHPIQRNRPEFEFGKQMSVLFAIIVLFLVGIAICYSVAPLRLVERLDVSIRQGRFEQERHGDGGTLADADRQPMVKAGKPLVMIFTSQDYVYTVQQSDTKSAVVVLPGVTATMTVTLKSGTWEFDLVQGCGNLSSEHQRALFVKAVE